MSRQVATVFGGSGFLGHEIANALLDAGWTVRVAARHPRASMLPGGDERVEYVAADIRDEAQVETAVTGASAVVNAVSLYVERRGVSFQDIHVEGAKRLARCARQESIPRLVQISGIGVDDHSPSAYVRARTRGEQVVRETFEGATVLRPSVIFGPRDAFLSTLRGVTRLPVVPLFGRGDTRLQPVFAADVAEAVAAALANPASVGEVYELGGASTYRYREIVQLVLDHLGRRRSLLPVPFGFWKILASLPGVPLTRDQVTLMAADNVAGEGAAGFAELAIEPQSLESALARSLD